jgi:hypothetical protein
MMVSVKRFHPSTRRNRRILKGIDIITGGSIIIPIDIRVLATTISITKKGIYNMKPIRNAVFSSLIMKDGTTTVKGRSVRFSGGSTLAILANSARSLSLVYVSM